MIKNIIFDLGGVLVDWNPMYVYRQIFDTEEKAQWFVDNICNLEWNEEQDGGRLIADAERLLIKQYPEWETEILAYYARWSEMLGGAKAGTVEIFRALKASGKFRLLALTNWSAETFPEARRRFEFLSWFEGILVSGEENLKKPDHRIYQLILDRYNIKAEESLFIDDNLRNIQAAEAMGINCIHFIGAEDLRAGLAKWNLL